MKHTQSVIVTATCPKRKKEMSYRVYVTVDFDAAAKSLIKKALRSDNHRAKDAKGIVSIMAG